MFGLRWNDLSNQLRGTILMITGTILLLHTLNILEKWLNSILIFISVAMIVYGFIQAGLWDKLLHITKKKE